MSNKERFVFKMLIMLTLASAFLLAQGESDPLNKIITADQKACNFMLSTDDWRILSAIALFLSAMFIAGMYIYGSVIDSSFIDRAKTESYQLVFTGILIVFFGLILSLMCGDFISSIFQSQGSAYVASYNYLNTLAKDYIQKTTINLAIAASILSLVSSTEIEGYQKTGTLLSWISDPISFFSDSLFLLFGSLVFAYVVTITQINILAIIPYLSLMFFIPVGMVFRSLYPFRKFGGALIGLGIGLYVFVPIVLLFNNMIMQVFTPPDLSFEPLQLQCIDNSDCYSHMCEYSSPPGFKICKPMKKAGEFCNSNFECKSGICALTSTGRKCLECGIEGSNNPICCPGFIRNESTGLCAFAKSSNELCKSDSECISGRCIPSVSETTGDLQTICAPKLKLGERCNSDSDCISNSCGGVAPNKVCKKTLVNEEDKQIILANYANYLSKEPSSYVSSNYEVSVSGMTTAKAVLDQSTVEQFLSSELDLGKEKVSLGLLYDLIIAPIVLVFILGVLLPLLNITLISKAVSDLSETFGAEIEIAEIWRLI
ncbi:MAG: hypothetical protein N3G74_00715 [Candidatus Micrarchaeota archaeon]|nr:hypothetical protein [Candidatus Micrarchaeota archaeon]